MTQPLRIALIGAGVMGRKHIGVLDAEPGFVLAGIADPSPDTHGLAQRRGVPWNAEPEALLDAARADAAIVASPNALHLPHGMACLRRGVPALLEKPVAETPEGGTALADTAERADVPLLVGHHRRHNPILEAAREAVAAGRIGRPVAANVTWLTRKSDAYFDIPWRREAPGGGPVPINLVHEMDALRFVMGEIVAVTAMTANAVRGLAVEDTVAAALRFASGALATVVVTDAAESPWNWELTAGENTDYHRQPALCAVIAGTEGSLSLPDLELWRHAEGPGVARGWNAPMLRERLALEPDDPYRRQLRHFGRVVRREEAPRVTARDAARSLALCLAVREAARTGATIEMPVPPRG